jgi:uncharacterized protein DUF3489
MQMTKLNQAQEDLLRQAAKADDGAIDAGGVAKATIRAFIRRGMMISIPLAEGGSRLLITEAGRAEIGAPVAAATPPPAKPAAKGKIGAVIELLRRPEGASIEAMMKATGWQAHSVRGAMSGAIKKERGLAVRSEKTDGRRIYRIMEGVGA